MGVPPPRSHLCFPFFFRQMIENLERVSEAMMYGCMDGCKMCVARNPVVLPYVRPAMGRASSKGWMGGWSLSW